MRGSGNAIDVKHSVNWATLRQLWPFLIEFKGRIFAALIFMIFAKLSTIALPFILKAVVDGLNTVNAEPTNHLIDGLPLWLLTPASLVIAYGFFRFTNVIFGEIRDTLFSRVTERTVRRVGLKVFKHLHALDVDFHLERRTGGLARDVDRGVNGISFIMRFMVFNIIPTLIEISLVVGILFVNYGIGFGIVTGLAIISYIVFSVIATNWRSKYVRATNEADSNSSTRAIDSLLNYETVKSFANEDYESNRYDRELELWENAKRNNRLSLFVLNSGQALIISAAITVLMSMAVSQVSRQQITVGDFVLINAFIMQLFMPLNFLGFIYREVRVAIVNIENMFDLLARRPLILDNNDAIALPSPEASIEFNDVYFGYSKNRKILDSLSFVVKPKQTVAIVGPSGSGKSTIVKLLLRFYDTTQGSIKIGDHDVRSVTQVSLRKNIGIVPQDTVLFNDSILENVRYGNPEASDEEVLESIRMAHLDLFIDKLPEGVSTLVGERGLKLSGGEKQRVAIARALLKRPPIMIFDEATSSLDSRSEAAILEAIEEISANYTSIVIAHRLSTIVNADNIIVLDNGSIIESGNHNELLRKNGVYAELWQTQQKSKQPSNHRLTADLN